jgi:hypothetical protein
VAGDDERAEVGVDPVERLADADQRVASTCGGGSAIESW